MREFSLALFPPSFLVQPIAVFFEWFFLKYHPAARGEEWELQLIPGLACQPTDTNTLADVAIDV
jgi:hypothetical protein